LKTIQELYDIGKDLLRGHSDADAGFEARVLLCKSVSIGEETFYAEGDRKVKRGEESEFLGLVSKRLRGVPLSYLTGEKEFWSLSFEVRPGVLIPRPESELIVEKVVELWDEKRKKKKTPSIKAPLKPASIIGKTNMLIPDSEGEVIVDIGTGSGNIAIALARELPDVKIFASDISKTALKVARLNAQRLDVSNVTFAQGSLFAPLEQFKLHGKCDFIVSNPPYVAQKDLETLQPEVRDFEPKRALVAGKIGLEFIQKLVKGAPKYLKPGGYLVLEIGFGQKEAVLRLFNKNDIWRSVKCFDDLSGIPRVVVAKIYTR
jgi:release factor glutamine methyltransferase